MDTVVLVTALAVSADALAAGFALALGGRLSVRDIAAIGGITFVLCLAAQCCSAAFARLTEREVGLLGGGILLVAALRGATETEAAHGRLRARRRASGAALSVGVAVGLDAAAAAFSLGMMGYRGLSVPLVFGAMHVLAVTIGFAALRPSRTHLADRIAALILFALAVWKLVSAFL